MATTLTLLTELGDRVGLDMTIAAYKTRGLRWLNLIQQDICSRFSFSFQFARETVQTVADKTAGTVSWTLGGTAFTGTSTAFASTDKRSFIQPQGSSQWYEVTNVSGQVLTVAVPIIETTNATGTYVLRKRYYDLTADVERMYDVIETETPNKLSNLGVYTLDTYQSDIESDSVSIPTGYVLFRQDPDIAASAAPVRQIMFYPAPDKIYNIEVKYLALLNDLSADTDIPRIPTPYLTVLLDGAEWMGSKYTNLDEEPSLKNMYEAGIAKMIESESQHDDYFPVLSEVGLSKTTRFLPFPSNYEQPR